MKKLKKRGVAINLKMPFQRDLQVSCLPCFGREKFIGGGHKNRFSVEFTASSPCNIRSASIIAGVGAI